ncbi:MAG: hypothetical protein JST04_14420 [Bdellovibrionales bacterium]|nr:hypothetical protein [Bdellovibrionales bacterium]
MTLKFFALIVLLASNLCFAQDPLYYSGSTGWYNHPTYGTSCMRITPEGDNTGYRVDDYVCDRPETYGWCNLSDPFGVSCCRITPKGDSTGYRVEDANCDQAKNYGWAYLPDYGTSCVRLTPKLTSTGYRVDEGKCR